MTETYYPFDSGAGANITEGQWRLLARSFAGAGTPGVTPGYRSDLTAFADSSGMQVKVQAGMCGCYGHLYESDATKTLAIAGNSSGVTRIDAVVVTFDFSANTATTQVITGGSSLAATLALLTQNTTARYDVLIALVDVLNGAATISASHCHACLDRYGSSGGIVLPIGSIIDYGISGGVLIPPGFLECDGRFVSQLQCPRFALLVQSKGATPYGIDGSGSIYLPDLRGRVTMGVDNMGGGGGAAGGSVAPILGQQGGEFAHALTTAELASHLHGTSTMATDVQGGHNHQPSDGSYNFAINKSGVANSPHSISGADATLGLTYTGTTSTDGAHSHDVQGNTDAAGSGTAHNNVQPYQATVKLIKIC